MALPNDRGAMEDCWTVGDVPRSRLYLFTSLISFFLLPQVECISVALCVFRSLLKKTANTYEYLLSNPSLSLHIRTFWWLSHLQPSLQKNELLFPRSKNHRNRDSRKKRRLFFHYQEIFTFFPKRILVRL